MTECKHSANKSWQPVYKKRELVAYCSTCGAKTGGRKKMKGQVFQRVDKRFFQRIRNCFKGLKKAKG